MAFKSYIMETLDWKNLPFGYIKTDYNIRCFYKDGKWGKLEVSSSEHIDIHIASTALHYGQEAFEGLKCTRIIEPIEKNKQHYEQAYGSWLEILNKQLS